MLVSCKIDWCFYFMVCSIDIFLVEWFVGCGCWFGVRVGGVRVVVFGLVVVECFDSVMVDVGVQFYGGVGALCDCWCGSVVPYCLEL